MADELAQQIADSNAMMSRWHEPDAFMRSELEAMRKRGITAADPFFFRFSFAEVEKVIRYIDRLKTDE